MRRDIVMMILFVIMGGLSVTNSASTFALSAWHDGTCSVYDGELRCWGSNNVGQLGIGNTDPLYEVPAQAIDLGASFTVKSSCSGYQHTCALSVDGITKCFGYNYQGQLGQGHIQNVGDQEGEMGDNLIAIDWGTNFVAEEIICMGYTTCALSSGGIIKCVGQILGTQNVIGRDVSELGDAIVPVMLGDNFEVIWIGNQNQGACALSGAKELKCWGSNPYGALGQEFSGNIGDDANEMGDYLKPIDLGNRFEIENVYAMSHGCCAVSTAGDLKCWGYNNNGQLGYGHTNNIGDQANEMGDFLDTVDLGTDFIVADMSNGRNHCCALSTMGWIKCWGEYRRLGLEDTQNRGDDSGEMGDNLPIVALGSDFAVQGMSHGYYVSHTCVYGTRTTSGEFGVKCWGSNGKGELGYGDTDDRGYEPGQMGNNLAFLDMKVDIAAQAGASSACDGTDMMNVNWLDMFHKDDAAMSLLKSHSEEFDATTYSLSLSVMVEYVGKSSDGNLNDDINLGTTYWIDLQSFTEKAGSVSEAGSCANRRAADYGGAFGEWWTFPPNPQNLDSTLTAERMAYPPSDWTISSTDCYTVTYQRTFTLAELTECTDSGGSALVSVAETSDAISYEGTFHVELLSPFDMALSAYYRTFSLLQYEFAIRFARSAGALASTGTLLFKMAATGISYDDAGEYEMRILTQSADFIELDGGVVVSNPMAMTGSSIVIEEETTECLVPSSSVCAQIFVVTIPSGIDCAVDASGDDVVDLSGLFRIGFSPQCRDQNAMCSAFVDGLGASGAVVLDLDWIFVDRTCGVNLFDAAFDVDLAFFKDDQFNIAVDDGAFIVDQDTIYGEVVVTWPSADEVYDLLAVSIANVFVCTAADDVVLSLNANDGSGGCLSSDVDANGLYTVIGSGADAQFLGDDSHESSSANTARFSFAAFETARTTINVHVEILLTLQTPNGRRRRRAILDFTASNQIRHSLKSAIVARPEKEAEGLGIEVMIGSAIGGVALFGVAVFVVVVVMAKRRRKRESGKGTNFGVSAADHVPDLSPTEVVPPTTDSVTIVYGGAAATKK